mgnify:CR=1 FL=1
MSSIADQAFSFSERKNGSVSIFWYGKPVTELRGKEAIKFISKINQSQDEDSKQLIMAKITGNFKRGNEKDHK